MPCLQVGEGKNLSDLLGAMFKLAYLRAVACSDPTAASSQTIADIISLTRPKLAESSSKFNFIEMIEVEPILRPKQEEDKGIVVKGIQKQHHFTRTTEGELVARPIPCSSCILADQLCAICLKLEKVSLVEVPRKQMKKKEQELENPEVEFEAAGEGDGGASDASDPEDGEEEGAEDEEEEELGPGSVVWARLLRHHPATVLAPGEVPPGLSSLITKAKVPSLFVRRFLVEDIKLVQVKRVELLGTNKLDRERAAKTPEIGEAYGMAVAVLRGDV